MKISTKGKYALCLMTELALNENDKPISVRDVAGRYGISDKYLEQIVILLNKAGLVQSSRGAQGGYRLTREPKEYTVGTVLRLTESSLAPTSCTDCEIRICKEKEECITLILGKKLDEAVKSVVDGITLADLAKWQDGLTYKA